MYIHEDGFFSYTFNKKSNLILFLDRQFENLDNISQKLVFKIILLR